ncbi:hypothetical protein QUA27_01765 [Microcoleus sp. Pol14C6]
MFVRSLIAAKIGENLLLNVILLCMGISYHVRSITSDRDGS